MHDEMTVGQTWRFKRDVALYAAHLEGLPQRLLADAFDLSPGSIPAILKKMKPLWPPDLKTKRIRKPHHPGSNHLGSNQESKNQARGAPEG
jgi:hypothetical protein